MKVYVINRNGHPLMPCTPAKARKLVRDGKARAAGCYPFTIQLLWDCEEHVQDVKEKLDARRTHRKNRRARIWYRPARFANRASSRRSGRLPPSIKANVEEVIRVVRQLPLPICHIVIEDVQVDIARLNNPTLSGRQYQDRARLDENLRIACLMRDDYQCQQCGKQHCRLEAHHLYAELNELTRLTTVYGYQTSDYRKARGLPKTHLVDALCVATLHTGEAVSEPHENIYTVGFRPRQIRRRYHHMPRKGQGRVRYQVHEELEGFHKGDIVQVKGRWVKQINAL